MLDARARVGWAGAAALAAGGIGFVVLRTFDPNAAGSLFPPCVFHSMTGLFCPGCGITRMLHALVHGDLRGAFAMNAMVLLMLPVLATMLVNEARSRRMVPGAAARLMYSPWAWLGVVVAFGVLRNLPFPPFAALAPG